MPQNHPRSDFWKWVAATSVTLALMIPPGLWGLDVWTSHKILAEAPYIEDRALILEMLKRVDTNTQELKGQSVELTRIRTALEYIAGKHAATRRQRSARRDSIFPRDASHVRGSLPDHRSPHGKH